MVKIIEQSPERILFTLSDDAYCALGLIGYPPDERHAIRLSLCGLTKKDTLHQAKYSGFETSLCMK